ncbi:uncharacterized protein LOC133730394 [Rosa rugosa]|uniref:uncharacterized protein LOC133730394 n=1 Tax=Rosa rugosa TaxID=74645 RepID=UPI002B402426|nr:uncharacterized protein LOC133730394 [Rosa rugosa]
MMRHPVDSLAWKSIDRNWPSFASEPRNLRLGLSSNGFNPFGDFSSRYSCWPVILVTYNLSPAVCMSKENLMLTLLIPGPKQLGNDIDVYLEPLIDDLKELWLNGVSVHDAFRDVTFNLKAVLMWTINDFPANGNLSGYSTKGKKACPVCGVQTCSKWLVNGKKHAYMDHRRFLPHDHPFRSMASSFDGTEEHRLKPKQLTGSEIYQVVQNIKNDWGKKKKGDNRKMMRGNRKRKKGGLNSYDDDGDNDCDDDGDDPMKLTKRWKKKSIFFELPYWQHLLLRHNLDMMHIEKNICESITGTFLNMKGKTKDNLNSRKDLREMGISKKLHRRNDGSSSSKGTTPLFVFLKEEKQIFCKRVFSLRPPNGYSSNISSRVSLEELKIFNLKSHDCHVLIQQVLSVALRGLLPKGPRVAIFRLCDCLNQLCQRVIDISKVELLENEIAKTLCMLERFFPPSFFDVMVHLPIHLVQEVLIGGPVHLRWMFPFERYVGVLNQHVKNRSNPEGSIAENYLAGEITRFCSGYIKQATNIGLQQKRNDIFEDETILEGQPFGRKRKRPLTSSMLEIAHRYVLANTTELNPWKELHKDELRLNDGRLAKNEHLLEKKHQNTFSDWLANIVRSGDCGDMSSTVRWIACKPKKDVLSCSGYKINGNRFHTREAEKVRK